MPRSPLFQVPEGKEGLDLVGVEPCGCVSAALAVTRDNEYACATEKNVRDFYADMAKTGREVRWMATEEVRAKLFGECETCARVA